MDEYEPVDPTSREARLHARQYAQSQARKAWLKQRVFPSPVVVGICIIGLVVLSIIAGVIRSTTADASLASTRADLEEPSLAPKESDSTSTASQGVFAEDNRQGKIQVHVIGQVKNPGVYTLGEGGRVLEAVEAAGGAIEPNDLNALNLARILTDGEQVRIPKPGELLAEGSDGGLGVGSSGEAETGNSANGGASGSATGSRKSGGNGKISLNQADEQTLQQLDGVGPTLAKRIVEYRKSNGPFRHLTDLKNVDGIGEKKYAALSAQVSL